LIGLEAFIGRIPPQRKVATGRCDHCNAEKNASLQSTYLPADTNPHYRKSKLKTAMNRVETLTEMEENALHDINFRNIPKFIVKEEFPVTTPPLLVLNGPQAFDVGLPSSPRRPGRSVAWDS
jgi:hypothetical protein